VDEDHVAENGAPSEQGAVGVMLLAASPLRVALLQYVLAREECTALELMQTLNLTRNGVGKHLDELTAAGFLLERRATHPRGVGGVIYWSADRERIAAELWRLTGDLLGYPPSAGGA
jgi:predicted ArsR family transcriptional regulator